MDKYLPFLQFLLTGGLGAFLYSLGKSFKKRMSKREEFEVDDLVNNQLRKQLVEARVEISQLYTEQRKMLRWMVDLTLLLDSNGISYPPIPLVEEKK